MLRSLAGRAAAYQAVWSVQRGLRIAGPPLGLRRAGPPPEKPGEAGGERAGQAELCRAAKLRAEAQATQEEKEELKQVCVGNRSFLV